MPVELTGFDSKVAVVTGAGRMRAMGRAIAVELARAGCDVVVTGTGRAPDGASDEEKQAGWRDIESVAEEIEALGRKATAVVCDISDPNAVESLASSVLDRHQRVDILVNNASAARGPDILPTIDLPHERWEAVLRTNLNGTFYMSKAFGRILADQGQGGSIVNISSVAATSAPAAFAAYAASKAGVGVLTGSMAKELAARQIRVNAICPGVTNTGVLDDVDTNAVWQQLLGLIPLGRFGQPSDIASLAVFLSSDQASWITGQSFTVDGGQYC